MDKTYYEFIPDEVFDGTKCSICGAEDFLFTPTTFGIVHEKIYCTNCIEEHNLVDEKKVAENEKLREYIKLNKQNPMNSQSYVPNKHVPKEIDPFEDCRWGDLSGEEAWAASWNCD